MTQAEKEQLLKQGFAIESMANAITGLAEHQQSTNDKLDDISTSIGKQELILEKLANLETNSKLDTNRVHDRISDVEEKFTLLVSNIKEDISKVECLTEEGCPALKLAIEQGNTANGIQDEKIKSNTIRLNEHDKTFKDREVIINDFKGTTKTVEKHSSIITWITRLIIGSLVLSLLGTIIVKL